MISRITEIATLTFAAPIAWKNTGVIRENTAEKKLGPIMRGMSRMDFERIWGVRQHRTIPALRLKHRSGGRGTASALPKCSIRHPVLSVLELADETDSKSVGGDTVWVRPPSPAFLIPKPFSGLGIFCVADKIQACLPFCLPLLPQMADKTDLFSVGFGGQVRPTEFFS